MEHLFLRGTTTQAEPLNYYASLITLVDHHQADQAGEATVFQPSRGSRVDEKVDYEPSCD